jgi:hypothetical protein
MKVKVLKKDIKKGCGGPYEGNCPIARALIRQTGLPWYVGTDKASLLGSDGISMGLADLPRSAKRFINKFDQSKPVEPFTFDLPPVVRRV